MTATIARHPLAWVTAGPLWRDAGGEGTGAITEAQRTAMGRPALLRFASDAFMDDLAALLDDDPSRLVAHRAEPISYRGRAPGREDEGALRLETLKLYQPVHGHFHLVAASLVCPRPGLPEHPVRQERQERVAFVVRRLEDGREHAWVPEPGSGSRRWSRLEPSARERLAAGEELQPMFPMSYAEHGRPRRLWVGLVPTASVESMRNAGPFARTATAADRATPPPDPRAVELRQRIVEPLRALQAALPPGSAPAPEKRIASLFLLLDLADVLRRQRPATFEALMRGDTGPDPLLAQLAGTRVHAANEHPTWAEAIAAAWPQRDVAWGEAPGTPSATLDLEGSQPAADALGGWLEAGLPPAPAPDEAAAEAAAATGEPSAAAGAASARLPKLDPQGGATYVLRCVYRRPLCEPLHDDLVSDPTEPFRIAGFFDLDAPARPFHVALPVDTSIRDLRQFKKNVTFALSDQLRQQMSRVSDMRSLMQGQLAAGEPLDVGMLCSFSIPIITIVALLLLMIMVQLLNIVFWWLPFFRICFPLRLEARR